MAHIEEEKIESEISGSVAKRLLSYMEDYKKTMFLCIILVLVITAADLIGPMMIGNSIDAYIEGYNRPYGVCEKSDLYFDGEYLTKKIDNCEQFNQLVLIENNYYYFKDLSKDDLDKLNTIINTELNYTLDNNLVTIDHYQGKYMERNDLKNLRHNDIRSMIIIGVLYVVMMLSRSFASFFEMFKLQKMGQDIIYDMRNEVFHHVHTLPLRFFDTHPVGRIVTRVTNDAEGINEMFSRILIRLFQSAIKIIGLACVMLYINTRLALYAFTLVPIITICTVLLNKLARKIHRIVRTKVSALNTFLSENISGMKLIQIFANEKYKFKQFDEKSNDLYHANMKAIAIHATFRPLIYLLGQMALVLVLYFGTKDVFSSVISIGTLYIFINYISNFFEPIQDMAEQFSTLQNSFASAEKIFTVLDEKNTIVEKEDAIHLEEIKGKIEFKNVWFAYEDDNYVLRDVSFVIEPGESVAFVGATGAGKSSILNLIGRYYDIQKGQILIDGVDIKNLRIQDIRKAIGQVQQDVFIFTGDIRGNIKLLDDISDEKMLESSSISNASYFINKLNDGYDEKVSERGSTLSSGQRQLLSFARVLAHDPKILVMDEATANIDTETESLIQDALGKMMSDKTTIMVAHRLSTIQHADKIIVMHKGKIREMGNHQELLTQNGLYKKLYELQLHSE